ncbi:truncated replication initiator protein [Coconut foliar decay alphasatellite 3]|uniref:Truncated replication initiator protein n=1 Tax=Coconut foliar decay alphasatellite 3 TaxID=2161876 RepID=A0A2R4N9A7_9VIRU|nr:truncated replication initiator protein [Coconut foliar decay alphasatellite 3]AVX29426.1 truncated replication initiator protein [Coconut foliar decay alphasatellite 3]
MAMRSRRWCFTLNYCSVEDRDSFLCRIKEEDIDYAIVGDEEAPSTGQKHLQGYLIARLHENIRRQNKNN